MNTINTNTHIHTIHTDTHCIHTTHTHASLLPTRMHTHACSYAHMRAHRDRDLAEIHSSFRTGTYLADTHSSFRTRTDWAKILKKTFKTTGQTGSKHVFFSEPVRTCFFFFYIVSPLWSGTPPCERSPRLSSSRHRVPPDHS